MKLQNVFWSLPVKWLSINIFSFICLCITVFFSVAQPPDLVAREFEKNLVTSPGNSGRQNYSTFTVAKRQDTRLHSLVSVIIFLLEFITDQNSVLTGFFYSQIFLLTGILNFRNFTNRESLHYKFCIYGTFLPTGIFYRPESFTCQENSNQLSDLFVQPKPAATNARYFVLHSHM